MLPRCGHCASSCRKSGKAISGGKRSSSRSMRYCPRRPQAGAFEPHHGSDTGGFAEEEPFGG
jgi:hypothetical protein